MKNFSRYLFAFALLYATLPVFAQGDKSKRASPPATASGSIGPTQVTINYSSPSVKGRKIFGDLVKYGSVWRAGANEATTISFSTDVTVEGKPLSKGKYALYVLPKNENNWTVIFNKKADQFGTEYEENKSQNVLQVDVTTSKIPLHEKLTYTVTSTGVTLSWETKEISFKVASK